VPKRYKRRIFLTSDEIYGLSILGAYRGVYEPVNDFAKEIIENTFQPYLSFRKIPKIKGIVENFDAGLMRITPLSYKLALGNIIILDGHHRTLSLMILYISDGLNIAQIPGKLIYEGKRENQLDAFVESRQLTIQR